MYSLARVGMGAGTVTGPGVSPDGLTAADKVPQGLIPEPRVGPITTLPCRFNRGGLSSSQTP